MIHKIIEEYADQQKEGSRFLRCPRCGQATMDHKLHRNAKSRRADIYICRGCGQDEAYEDLLRRSHANELEKESYLLSWWIAEQKLEPIRCEECEYRKIDGGRYECSKGYKDEILSGRGCVRGKVRRDRR